VLFRPVNPGRQHINSRQVRLLFLPDLLRAEPSLTDQIRGSRVLPSDSNPKGRWIGAVAPCGSWITDRKYAGCCLQIATAFSRYWRALRPNSNGSRTRRFTLPDDGRLLRDHRSG